jgi:hypothetical protein
VSKKNDGQQWADNLVRKIGLALKNARGGKSAKWLSDRTAELGYRISPTVIAKLDSGHRGSVLSVAELLILGAALELPPAALLIPNVLEDVEVLPGKATRGISAFGWFMGAGYQVGLVRDVSYVPDGVRTSDAMRIPLQLLQIEAALAQHLDSLLQSERGPEVLTMPDAWRHNMKEQAEVTRDAIRILEDERDRLIEAYRKSHGGKDEAEK